eukprot:224337-Prymnesium_polylepis.1
MQPAYLRTLYPQCLLLNGEGIGGEFREKVRRQSADRTHLFDAARLSPAAAAAVAAMHAPRLLAAAYML